MKKQRIVSAHLACLLALMFGFLPNAPGQEISEFPNYLTMQEKARQLWTNKNIASTAYIVLVPSGSPLMKAAKKLADYRKAEILNFSPASPEDCLPDLIKKNTRYAAIFVEPKDMDVNLLRKFIVISTLLDSDPFCDFAFGFITASSPQKVEEFVQRIIAADQNGVQDYAIEMAVSDVSFKSDTSFLPGMKGESYYINFGDTNFAKEAISHFDRAGFINIGACSDPEGIWLFDDQRNMDETKHWPYDPKKVGQDPKHEMPRITPGYFKGLKLKNAVVWTHACHLGAVGRAFIEGDIVSTFGASQKLEEYWIPEGRSMALAIIDSGVSAYLCPIGANFGMQADQERDIAIETGVPLGDVMRRGYHDIVMDTKGHPEKIGIFIAGKPKYWEPDGFTNNNSPQHRCLYGDPLFAPFKNRKTPASLSVTTKEKDDGIRITFKLNISGFDIGRTWYGNRSTPGRGRFYEEITLGRNVEQAYIKEIRTCGAGGKPFKVSDKSVLLEKIDGKTVLHVQIVTPDLDIREMDGGNPREMSVLQKAGASAEIYVNFGNPSPVAGDNKK